jgi:hypothetical protein
MQCTWGKARGHGQHIGPCIQHESVRRTCFVLPYSTLSARGHPHASWPPRRGSCGTWHPYCGASEGHRPPIPRHEPPPPQRRHDVPRCSIANTPCTGSARTDVNVRRGNAPSIHVHRILRGGLRAGHGRGLHHVHSAERRRGIREPNIDQELRQPPKRKEGRSAEDKSWDRTPAAAVPSNASV